MLALSGSTTIQPMLWLMANQSILAFGIQQVRKITIGWGPSPTLRRYDSLLHIRVFLLIIMLLFVFLAGCFPHLFFFGESCLLWERESQVVPWGAPSLSKHTNHLGGHQAGFARRQGNHWETKRQETLPHYLPTGMNSASTIIFTDKLFYTKQWFWF